MALSPIDRAGKGRVRVLLVDDDEDDYRLTRGVIADIPGDQYSLDWVADIDQAEDLICQQVHDVYLIDFRLGARSGLDLLAAVRRRKCHGPAILLTGMNEPEIDRAAEAAGAADFIVKSQLDPILLERAIRYTLRQRAQELDLERKVAARTTELTEANRALADADRRKDQYLATLAHELRNPLAPIRNALEIMRLSADRPKLIENGRMLIERQVATLVRLIDDLLDVSRFTRDTLTLSLEPLDLREPLRLAIEATQPLMDKAHLTLTSDLPPVELPIHGDRVRMAQVFAQLLNNAVKYSQPQGTISLNVKQTKSQNGPQATIQIVDTGVGIPRDQLPRVFDLFCQVDRTLGRAQNGLGIGLAFVRKLARLHDGDITADSDGLNRGATFSVTLPLGRNPS